MQATSPQRACPTQHPLPLQRAGHWVRVLSAENAGRLTASYAIIAPYTRIADLANPLSKPPPPQAPTIHQWHNQPDVAIDTGAGQGGIWWVHQTSAGTLELQMVADGIARGTEQTPTWLAFLRQYLMQIAGALAIIGTGLLFASLFRNHASTSFKVTSSKRR